MNDTTEQRDSFVAIHSSGLVQREGNTVTLVGDMAIAHRDDVRRSVQLALQTMAQEIVVDLTRCELLHSSVVAAILTAGEHARLAGMRCIVRGANEHQALFLAECRFAGKVEVRA